MLFADTHPLRTAHRSAQPQGIKAVLPSLCAQAPDNLWRQGPWPDFPYRSVEVHLSEGSFFRLPTEGVARLAAEMLFSATQCSAQAHLYGQLVPAVRECPELLLEMAGRLPWTALRGLARNARWRTPPLAMGPQLLGSARMVLSTCGA